MRSSIFLAACLLAGCAAYDGRGLRPGVSGENELLASMGEPAMRWTLPDGGQRLAFPRGPAGVHTYMATLGADGKLVAVENALTPAHFAQIRAEMTSDDVLRLLGPNVPAWTVYFKARDELVWEWRYCDDWHQLARFDVLFDGTTQRVRSTLSQTEDQLGHCGRNGEGCWCSR